ncbi:HlyD family secretion protein [Verrucomicrobiota bacterium sgz303538]
MLRAFLFLAVFSALAYGGWQFWEHRNQWVSTDNAFVQGHVHQISPRVAGTVSEVLVEENDYVNAGQPLVRLDPSDFEVRLAQAKAAVAQADAQMIQARADLAAAEAQKQQSSALVKESSAQVDREGAAAEKAKADFGRATELYAGRSVISKAELDAAKAASSSSKAAVNAAQSSLAGSRAKVEAAEAALNSAQAAIKVAEAQKQRAQAELRDAELQLSYTTITAPVSGRVGKKTVEVGHRLQPGQALFAVVEEDAWVVANFKETQLESLTPGQRVQLKVDAFPGHEFTGIVESFAPASGAQFALLPPDNATGNFTKIVQRVPVRIQFDRKSLKGFEQRIVPGLSVIVDVHVRS